MNCFVVFDGDGIGQMVEKARLSDDLPMVKILSTKIDAGNQVFKLWAESHGTNAIEIGGDEGAVEIPADYLSELSAIKEKYESAVGATVSIGVGMKLSEANRALVYAKVTGKNKICFYTDSMQETLSKLKERSEQEKQGEILGKSTVAMNEGSAAGFSGAHPPAAPTVAKPVATQGEHSEAQSMYDMLAEQKEDHPPTPEATHAEEDIEQSLHQFAAQSDEEDKQSGHERAQRLNAIKSQVVQALQALKAQAPLLEQLKSQAPDTYNAMMGLSNAVIQFARELSPQASTDNLSKSEPMSKAEGVSLEHYSRVPGLKYVDTSHMGTGAPSAEYRQGLPDVPRAYYYRAGSAPEPIVAQGSRARYKASLGPEHRLYDLGEDPENLGPPSRAAFMEGRGKGWSPQDTLLHEVRNRGYYGYYNSRSSQPNTVALFYDHPVEPMDKDEASPVEKRMLPMAEAGTTTKRHHVVLPPGSILGNKIKVQHSDGTESWKQVSSGMIRSQDPSGHPVSSRAPNSK